MSWNIKGDLFDRSELSASKIMERMAAEDAWFAAALRNFVPRGVSWSSTCMLRRSISARIWPLQHLTIEATSFSCMMHSKYCSTSWLSMRSCMTILLFLLTLEVEAPDCCHHFIEDWTRNLVNTPSFQGTVHPTLRRTIRRTVRWTIRRAVRQCKHHISVARL